MRSTTKSRIIAGLSLTFVAAFSLSACAMNGDADTADEGMSTPSAEATTDTSGDAEGMESDAAMDPAANLVGPGCAAYAEMVPDGAGSVQGMAQDPVAVAASNNPMLTTLVAAVSGQLNPDVDLVDVLNSDEYTVFAPVDDAFAAIDPATIEGLKTDSETLSAILSYHVVAGQIEPDDIVGTHTTLQGAELEVTGEGDNLMVNGATVLCGGVQTSNATVYLIDGVLMPPAQ